MMLGYIVFAALLRPSPVVAQTLPREMLFTEGATEKETTLSYNDFIQGTFVPANEPLLDPGVLLTAHKFEGDIDGVTSPGLDGAQRNAVKGLQYRWPTSDIPYTISSRYSSYSRARIAAAMEQYTEKTCVKFVPRQTELDYIHIMPDKGCYSMVGRVGGRQVVSLGYGCIHKGIIIHELMHAVGFYHEQSRTDRDDYVQVMWKNIQPGMEGQFSKYTLSQIQYLSAPYDYGSIMHYGPRDFSVNGQDTLVPLKKGHLIGQRRGFSPVDILKINRLYKCHDTSSTTATIPPDTIDLTTVSQDLVCKDLRPDCATLAGHNYCDYAKKWMSTVCAKSCQLCTSPKKKKSCHDLHPYCEAWKEKGYCHHTDYKPFLYKKCQKTCEFCDRNPFGE